MDTTVSKPNDTVQNEKEKSLEEMVLEVIIIRNQNAISLLTSRLSTLRPESASKSNLHRTLFDCIFSTNFL